MPVVTIVIPVLNEAATLPHTLTAVRQLQPQPDMIVVDGQSTDGTWAALSAESDIHVLQAPRGRAKQMNAGAAATRGEWLLFLHADTLLPQESYAAALAVQQAGTHTWGWFDIRFDDPRPAFGLLAWAINRRARLRQSPTGDQAVFVRRDTFEAVGGFPALPLMEDVALARLLRERGSGYPIAVPVITSARRWRQGGILRTILRMWFLKLQYLAGRDPAALAARYADHREPTEVRP